MAGAHCHGIKLASMYGIWICLYICNGKSSFHSSWSRCSLYGVDVNETEGWNSDSVLCPPKPSCVRISTINLDTWKPCEVSLYNVLLDFLIDTFSWNIHIFPVLQFTDDNLNYPTHTPHSISPLLSSPQYPSHTLIQHIAAIITMCTQTHARYDECAHTRLVRWSYCSILTPSERVPETGRGCRRYERRYTREKVLGKCMLCFQAAPFGAEDKDEKESRRFKKRVSRMLKGLLG